MLLNKSDNLSFERIINTPKRGVGKAMVRKLYEISNKQNLSLFDATKIFCESGKLTNSQNKNLRELINIIEKHTKLLKTVNHFEVAGSLLDDVGYTEMLQNEKTPEAEGRLENLKKLVSDIKNRSALEEFIEEVSLLTENLNESEQNDKISLMTLHSAKGLEFDFVFLPGWEEGIFPNQRNIDEFGNKGLEEERRLAYVGITRARKELYISYVNFRKQYNYNIYRSIPSRFLSELPKKNCQILQICKSSSKEKNKLLQFTSEDFKIGDKVMHKEFGIGTILGISEKKLQIRFDRSKEIIKIFSDFVSKI